MWYFRGNTIAQSLVTFVMLHDLRVVDLPIKAWKNVRKKKKVSVPDQEIKYGNMSRLIKSATSRQKYDSIKSKYLAEILEYRDLQNFYFLPCQGREYRECLENVSGLVK